MSWIDRVNTGMTITTGDGKAYKPLWRLPVEDIQYNTTPFEFVAKRGTLVYRGQDKGSVYNLEFYFQGEDNIDQAQAFKISARDSRPWEISHPLYDTIIVQPARINIDNTSMNSTKITASVMETITDKLPSTSVSPADKIQEDVAAMQEAIAAAFEGEPLTTREVTSLTNNNADLYDKGKNIKDPTDADAYYNAFKTANAAITKAIGFPLNAMRQVQRFISAPAQFAEGVQNRIDTMLQQAASLRGKITNLLTRGDKVVYEATVAGLTGSIALAAITNPDYTTVTQVLRSTTKLTNQWNTFLTELDSLSSDNGGEVGAYIPNPEIIGRLGEIVKFTLAHLKVIALGQRVEHSLIVEEDTNVILLTHRLYGMDSDDANLSEIVDINEIGINEMLRVRKGRTIKYYV